jgi:hypothetical protein
MERLPAPPVRAGRLVGSRESPHQAAASPQGPGRTVITVPEIGTGWVLTSARRFGRRRSSALGTLLARRLNRLSPPTAPVRSTAGGGGAGGRSDRGRPCPAAPTGPALIAPPARTPTPRLDGLGR